MAVPSLRLRRALATACRTIHARPFTAAARIGVPYTEPSLAPPPNPGQRSVRTIQFFGFRTSAPLLDRRTIEDDRKIDPDEILFEGCDYNHWLITMEFPKDPKPTPEEMVETYVQTLAKVVGSVEEAKKRMYACSTTTYNGFQAVMTEEMSEKFRGLPGVVFILPDSYIDPVNKEYGGDKYDNGVITPRPPPVQYGRQGRYGDRNRNYDRPRFDRQQQGPPPQQPNYGPPRGYGPGEGGRDGRFPQGQGTGSGYGGGYQQQGYQGPPPPPPSPGSWDRNQGYQGPPPPPGGNWDGRNQGNQGPPSPPGGNWNQGNQGPPSPPGGNWNQGYQGSPPPGGNYDGRNQGYQGPPPPGGSWDGRNQGQR